MWRIRAYGPLLGLNISGRHNRREPRVKHTNCEALYKKIRTWIVLLSLPSSTHRCHEVWGISSWSPSHENCVTCNKLLVLTSDYVSFTATPDSPSRVNQHRHQLPQQPTIPLCSEQSHTRTYPSLESDLILGQDKSAQEMRRNTRAESGSELGTDSSREDMPCSPW